ncbi:MAG: porin family protein [Saprospiraceae bacterium]|nr:porin family protein [Saprospiraceae bacterium]
MRILCTLVCGLFLWCSASSQATIQFNPQVGINFTRLSEDPENGIEVEGKAGYLLGADLRIGRTAYIQPGIFLNGTKTVYSFQDSVFIDDAEIKQHSLKLRTLLGAKFVNKENLKVRIAGGPSYDFQLSLNDDNHPIISDENIRNGAWNAEIALGVDFLIFTAEAGYSIGLTDVFDEQYFQNAPKYQTFYFTVGIVFGR